MPGIMPNTWSRNDEQLIPCSHGSSSPAGETDLTLIIRQIVQVETTCSEAKEFSSQRGCDNKESKAAWEAETSGRK